MNQQNDPANNGPFITAALFCEAVLDEKDNVKSLIRVIDRLLLQVTGIDAPEQMPPIQRSIVMAISLKSGQAVGPVPIRILGIGPSGLTGQEPIYEGTVHLEGGVRGHT